MVGGADRGRRTGRRELQLIRAAGVCASEISGEELPPRLNKPNGQYVIARRSAAFLKTLPLYEIRAWGKFPPPNWKIRVKNLRGYSTVRSGDASQTLW